MPDIIMPRETDQKDAADILEELRAFLAKKDLVLVAQPQGMILGKIIGLRKIKALAIVGRVAPDEIQFRPYLWDQPKEQAKPQ